VVIFVPKDITDLIEILYDTKNNGKEVPWIAKRLITLRLAQAYKRIDSDKYKRIIECAGYLEFRRYSDYSLKLHTANFCQTRLCPTCNWRRSYKVFAKVSRIMKIIENEYSYVFLTLTCKNITGVKLHNQIDKLVSAFKTLCLRKRFKDAVHGWVRVFEITYNWKSEEYHPHYHCILAVKKEYFTTELYIHQNEWCLLWKDCLKVAYKPIVDIRTFTESEKGKGKEVAEVAKYTIKASNIMANLQGISDYSKDIQDEVRKITDKITDVIVYTLDVALANRRLIGYGGIFKQKHRVLNLDINDESDLVHTGLNPGKSELDYHIERYGWNIKYRKYIRLEDRK
jgi:plasmid rolling circle replication initiator protein Rep